MKIISFAYTTAALLSGHKTVTRRYWNAKYAASFKIGETVQAWDKSPRYGGKKVAEIKIISITLENMIDAPDSDYEKEGFQYMCDNNIAIFKGKKRDYPPDGLVYPDRVYWRAWKTTKEEKFKTCYVVRFEVLEIIKSVTEYPSEAHMRNNEDMADVHFV